MKSFWQTIKSFCHHVSNKDLDKKLDKILMNQKEEAAALLALKDQLTKANGEIQDKIKALQDAVENAPVSAEVADAIAGLTTATQALDDIVPDPVPPPSNP